MDTGLQNRINKSISQAYKGNLTADALMRLVNDCLDQSPDRKIIHQLLDLAHLRLDHSTAVLKKRFPHPASTAPFLF